MYRICYLVLPLAVTILISACGKTDQAEPLRTAYLKGQITVDPELDTLRNYSGFQLRIVEPDSLGQLSDTLFHAVTDSAGIYEGEARFPRSGVHSLALSRHGEDLALVDVILVEKDTIKISGEFPDFENSMVIESEENELFDSYRRLQAGVSRLYQFAGAGMVSADTLNLEIKKWSDLFWDFYSENKGTFAGQRSAATSIRILEGLENELMMQRLKEAVEDDPHLIPFASRIGVRYYAGKQDLDYALAYIDSLERHSSDDRIRMELKRNRINLLYDSARVESARLELDQFKDRYLKYREASTWAERFESDLTLLAPGSDLPEFAVLSVEGDSLTKAGMTGSPYILEFTRLDNVLYQDQFDRNIAIHHIYKNYGVNFITIPFGANDIVLNAFFEERARLWPFIQPGSFDADDLVETFNINVVPTRILVDQQGRVVRKYEGTEFNDIIRGLQIVLKNDQEEPS
ncbi:MAG: hypothetical protein WD317_05435 [Balneolaceae bacterium]